MTECNDTEGYYLFTLWQRTDWEKTGEKQMKGKQEMIGTIQRKPQCFTTAKH